MTRRGVVFTLIALILIAYLLAADKATSSDATVTAAQADIARTRLDMLDAYVRSFEDQVRASVATAGYLALENLSGSVRSNGTFIARMNDSVRLCVVNSTIAIQGTKRECLPQNAWLNTSIDRLTNLSMQELGVTTRYVIHNVTVTEAKPFEVLFTIEISYNITDPFARFVVNRQNLTVAVDVSGIHDPLYEHLNAAGKISESRTFRRSRLLRFEVNSTNFPEVYDNRTYVQYLGQAPSVLDRFMNRTSRQSDCCGIESVVRVESFVAPTADYMNYSAADHQFARHLANALPEFKCNQNEVRALDAPGPSTKKVILETVRFDNLYNLTGSELSECAWSWP